LTISIPFAALASDTSLLPEQLDYMQSKKNNFIVPNDVIDEQSLPKVYIKPFAENPGDGATRVNLTTYGWYGAPIVQDEESGSFDLKKDIVMTILGALTTTFGGIVLSVADMALSNVETTQTATAKTMISYNYPTKQGQAWYSNTWHTLFESTNRNTYKHYYSLWMDKNKNTRQYTVDYVPANGYSAIKVEAAPHYYDNNYILQQTAYNYAQSKKYTDEDWLD
ncbi:hypothetical protein, partial [Paenibacillus sp. oral taxon 786]